MLAKLYHFHSLLCSFSFSLALRTVILSVGIVKHYAIFWLTNEVLRQLKKQFSLKNMSHEIIKKNEGVSIEDKMSKNSSK